MIRDQSSILSVGLDLDADAGDFQQKELNIICIWTDSHISLSCKLVPVQYQEYENGQLDSITDC